MFYHLRHPLLALDLIHEHVARDLLVFQSMQRGSAEVEPVAEDYSFFEPGPFDRPGYPKMHFIEHRYAGDPTNWWVPNRACVEALRCAAPASTSSSRRRRRRCSSAVARAGFRARQAARGVPSAGSEGVIEAVMLWNEPNNKSHWAFEEDPTGTAFAEMTILASRAVARGEPGPRARAGRHLPIDPLFIRNMAGKGVLDELDAVAVHGFPLDWNHWQIHEWPERLKEIQAVTDLPVWVSEVGISTFGAEEVQVFGLKRTAELLIGRALRLHWYSLYDLPREWPATTRHKEAEGSSYYRHFYMGLLREDGSPKLALPHFSEFAPELGICQWFHFEDHRLQDAVRWLRRLGCATSAPA